MSVENRPADDFRRTSPFRPEKPDENPQTVDSFPPPRHLLRGGEKGGKDQPPKWRHPGVLNTTPNPSTCPRCKAPTWQAVIDGFTTRLDPQFLDTRTELLARLQGRHIYQTIPGTNLPELQWRTVTHIASPNQPLRILATHTCTPPPHPALEPIWPTRHATELPEEPEF